MKNFGFIGAFDKLDLLLYIAKILSVYGKKIIIIDTTLEQKSKYIVPMINPTKSYIARFENIDIAIGFETYEDIETYREQTEGKKNKYDYALVSIDSINGFEKFFNQHTVKNYFVTSYDLYSIKKGLEAVSMIRQPVELTKVIFSTEISEEDSYYLDYISLGYKVGWNEKVINFPYETKDLEVMIENQKIHKIKIKNLSGQYKDTLEYLIIDMIPDINIINLKRVIKNIEKEG